MPTIICVGALALCGVLGVGAHWWVGLVLGWGNEHANQYKCIKNEKNYTYVNTNIFKIG